MQLTFASYNIHKGVGLDRRRDPERILSVLHEIDADIIALQEADRRIGERASVLPRADIDDTRWRVIEVARRPRSIGWHGNALLVRRDVEIVAGHALDIPTLEPRGAACGGGAGPFVAGVAPTLDEIQSAETLARLYARKASEWNEVDGGFSGLGINWFQHLIGIVWFIKSGCG